jgi:AAA ATPase domain
MAPFVGRAGTLARLDAALPGGGRRLPSVVLVAGEAGMGKTALLARFADRVAARGARPVWGTCWDGERAPAFWPWTQALRALLDGDPGLSAGAAPELGYVLPEWGTAGDGTQLRIFDAVAGVLGRAAAAAPLVVVLDDLQWADRSTVDLLRYLCGNPLAGPVLLLGAYRPDEAGGILGALPAADRVTLGGLSEGEVAELVGDAGLAPLVHRRSGGHPFFARELAQVLATEGPDAPVPAAVREAIARRAARLSPPAARLLEVAAVAGPRLRPDVLAEAGGEDPARTADLLAEGTAAGLLTATGFAHDLYREAVYAALPPARRLDLHHRVGRALAHRRDRGGAVFAAELARHFASAAPVAGAGPAFAWARLAAEDDAARFAFAEGADHLRRARSAVTDAGLAPPDADLVDLLAAEADLRLRAGDAATARELLDLAWDRVRDGADPARMATVVLGYEGHGARFAMPRTDLVSALERTRAALAGAGGAGTAAEARVTAALARQLQHSVARERHRAGPLAERAVAVARDLDDPAILADCLLALHDSLWTAGTAPRRVAITAEMAALAGRCGDRERHAQALLLAATAHLENGSPAFRAALAEYRDATARLRQPRHDYLLRTREAALALLDGDIEGGERASAEAAALGERVGDADAGNVRMSQRLEVARARAEPAELRAMAAEAVAWWVGAPAHAHAVAAGFAARAGDLDAARREVDTVLALDDWHADRSYLWSVFVGELVTAAIALDDRALCRRLLDNLTPVADACAVNGAFVCFMGAHAHRVGLLHAALGEAAPAGDRLRQAVELHRRLGARAWEAESRAALARLDPGHRPHPTPPAGPALRLVGDMWEASFRGRTAYLRDAKGLHDLAALLAAPGRDLSALDLAGASVTDGAAGPAVDRAALHAYRRRLAELDEEIAGARAAADLGVGERLAGEREAILAELRRATRPGGGVRPIAATAAERARKAVSARVRDAIQRLGQALPELGAHLDRTIRTGTTCAYEPGRDSSTSRTSPVRPPPPGVRP